MSDSAFKTAPYPGLTNDELRAALERGPAKDVADRMRGELARRAAVAAGDRSVMTAGERLRFARAREA